jgi:hypothetical protein
LQASEELDLETGKASVTDFEKGQRLYRTYRTMFSGMSQEKQNQKKRNKGSIYCPENLSNYEAHNLNK